MAAAADMYPAFAQQSGDDPPGVGFHMGILASAHDNAHCRGPSTDGAAQFVKRSEFAARALEDCARTAVVRRRTLSKHRVTRVSAVGANRTSRATTLQRWAVCAALPVAVLAFWFGVLM